MLRGRHVEYNEAEIPESERYTGYKGEGIDPASVNFHPLAEPQGVNPKFQMIPCEMCSLQHACWRSVINYGPMLLPECEMSLSYKTKVPRAERKFNTNEEVLAYVREHPGLHCYAIARGMERSPTHLRCALKRLTDKGVLKKVREHQSMRYYVVEKD